MGQERCWLDCVQLGCTPPFSWSHPATWEPGVFRGGDL